MESSAETTAGPPLPVVDLDVNPLPGQTANAVLDLNGKLVRGNLSPNTAALLYAMMQETGQLKLQQQEFIQRVTVTLSNTRYIMARDEHHLYISKQRIG